MPTWKAALVGDRPASTRANAAFSFSLPCRAEIYGNDPPCVWPHNRRCSHRAIVDGSQVGIGRSTLYEALAQRGS